jgi:hypothetical protein
MADTRASEQPEVRRTVRDTSITAVGGTFVRIKRWFIEQVQDDGVKQNLNATILIGLAGLIGLIAGLVGWFVGAVDNNWEVRQQLQMEHYKQRQEIFAKVANDLPRTSAALRQHAEYTIWLNAVYDPEASVRMDARDSFARAYEDVVKARDELAKSLRENDNFVTSCQLVELRFGEESYADEKTRKGSQSASKNAELARQCAQIVRRRLDLMTELNGRRADKRAMHVEGLKKDTAKLNDVLKAIAKPVPEKLAEEAMKSEGATPVPVKSALAREETDTEQASPVAEWVKEVEEYVKTSENKKMKMADGTEELKTIADAMNDEEGPAYRARWKQVIEEESNALLAANYRAADAAFYLLVQAMSDNLAEQRLKLEAESQTSGVWGVTWIATGPWYVKIGKGLFALAVASVMFFSGCLLIAWLIDTADDYKREREEQQSKQRMAEAMAVLGTHRSRRRKKQRELAREDARSTINAADAGASVAEVKDPHAFSKEMQI